MSFIMKDGKARSRPHLRSLYRQRACGGSNGFGRGFTEGLISYVIPGSMPAHVVAPQGRSIPEVQFSVVYDRMGPGGTVMHRWLEHAVELERLRIRFYERYKPLALISEIKLSVGVEHGGRTAPRSLGLPRHFSGHQFEARGDASILAASAVEVIADKHYAAVMVFKGLRPVEHGPSDKIP